MTLAQAFDRIRRHRWVPIAAIAASALLLGVATAGHAAVIDAQARASRHADLDRVAASIASTLETGRGVVGAHFTAAVCVAEASAQLAPVVDGGGRFTAASLHEASAVVHRAAVAALVPAYDPAQPKQVPGDANVDERDAALVKLRRAQMDAEAEVAALASKARRTEQECAFARSAVASIVDEVTRRTDELIAANPKAAAEAVVALTVARDAVVAAETAGVEEWIAAAAALEASHAAAVLAEQQADEIARQAAEAAQREPEQNPEAPAWRGPIPPPPSEPGPRDVDPGPICTMFPGIGGC
ncbi:hypothetical protein [Agromyces albus]|uniref:hypothetical protein n=1 Tax=Agromyces albus TaxID=205332 RepID=UPI0027863391|nr:hypothetical protein [Agromyces albus]MDQ0574333.1 hypothetical protein [Agromyces albus]